ncbi:MULTISPECIES: hypothetical protein [unclassified Haladaptatus]|uniref:hypothetical protein n=1 Tax=unclassified Haladaptatus TaxID=2622732 RepID=UPI00209BC1A6|nr:MULTISPECIES: hypothetical protein [unclassified Haladaptatus]MCO8244926.1 hypothetical protein [Haladaptatus sp. AB643]MCO8255561.1 hypothetical protein [Haladaptatus sp. AB618]
MEPPLLVVGDYGWVPAVPLASPIGLAVALALGLGNVPVAWVFILLTAMPIAVPPVIFAVEFASDTAVRGVALPEHVSVNRVTTTLVSIPVLSIVVPILKTEIVV